MKPSILFRISKPGLKGRKSVRHLNDQRVSLALAKSKDVNHQIKFMSSINRMKAWAAMENAVENA